MIPWNTFHSLGQLLEDGELEEIELENESYRIKLNRSVASGAPVAAPQDASTAEGTGGEEATGGDSSEDNWIEITSPMVGTFYKAPAPDADPFVEVGDQIEEGETVCIIEAMKLMNEIEADNAGTIQKVCCENAEPVSKGDVLFYLEPA